jgi:protein-S-isoprenylcysteine O-methyltransferase Ste14
MLLQEQLSRNGAWLFRWRSYLPLVFIAVMIPAFQEFRYPFDSHAYHRIWEMFCFAITLVGLLIRCYTIGYVPKGTSGRNTKSQVADTLNTTGMYSVIRNPLYLGNFFMMLGVNMFVRVWWVCVIYALAFWLYYERIIMAEEAFLKDKFGEEYENYLRRTPVFIPNFKLWQPPILPFSLRNVMRREYSGFFGAIAAFTALEFAGEYVVQGAIVFDPVWVGIFSFGLLVYLTLRTLKKKTRLLDVERR